MAKLVSVKLVSTATYSQSRPHDEEKKPKELPKDYEERTWKQRMHVLPTGQIFIPPMAFKNCLSEVAKYLSLQIPGKGKSTYTKHFEAGVSVSKPVPLFDPTTGQPVLENDAKGGWIFTPSDGVKGGGKRVWKCYPLIDQWIATVDFVIIDDIITPDVFWSHLKQAGMLIGVGRFRPRNGGYYGTFSIVEGSEQWQEL